MLARKGVGLALRSMSTSTGTGTGAFRALVVRGKADLDVIDVASLDALPAVKGQEKLLGDASALTTVSVSHSTLNYKDGMVLCGMPGVARSFPVVPGVDFAGEVLECGDGATFAAGAAVVLTGHYAGQHVNGGFSQRVRVPTSWLVARPARFSAQQAMTIGTAGFTAMQSIMWLEQGKRGGLDKGAPLLVTGASGGVGSTAVAIAAALGFTDVVASTGRVEANEAWLKQLGASRVVGRVDAKQPLDKELYAACVDTVGGDTLAAVLAQMQYDGCVAACGVAAGPKVATSVFPFILRNVALLGVDSVQLNREDRLKVYVAFSSSLNHA